MNQTRSQVIQCTGCGAKNRIPSDMIETAAKCGKCGMPLQKAKNETGAIDTYTFRCAACGTKNRIPGDKIEDSAKCGKCKADLETDELFESQPVMATDINFDSKVLKSPLPVLLYCWSTGCPSCQITGPIIDQFAAESKGRVRVAKLDVGANPGVAAKYHVLGVPFLLIFDNGQMKESLPGVVKKHEIMMKMAHYL